MRRRVSFGVSTALGVAVVLCLLLTIVYPSYLNFSTPLGLLPSQSLRRGALGPPLLSPTTRPLSFSHESLSDTDRLKLFAVHEVRIDCAVAFVVSCSFYCNPPLAPRPTTDAGPALLSPIHRDDSSPTTGHKLCTSSSITSASG